LLLPKIVGLDAPVISIAVVPDGAHGLIATGNQETGIFQLIVASMPAQRAEAPLLRAGPTAAGNVAEPIAASSPRSTPTAASPS
jgi:hypothetical protein